MRNCIKVSITNITLLILAFLSMVSFLNSVVGHITTAFILDTFRKMEYSFFSVNVITVDKTYSTGNYFLIPVIGAIIYNAFVIVKNYRTIKNKASMANS